MRKARTDVRCKVHPPGTAQSLCPAQGAVQAQKPSIRPQLVIQDLGGIGRHNGASGTVKRLQKAAAWKRQRIIMVIPTAESIAVKVYLSHCNLIFPPNNGVVRMPAIGMEVGHAYSLAVEQILAHPELTQWEYLLTVEHDNIPPPDGVLRLVEQMEAHPEFDCIGGLYFTKGEGGCAQIWGDPKDPVLNFRPQPPGAGLVECCGTGMGFNLWRLKMFKDPKLRRPWFVTDTKGGVFSQDLYFWMDARRYGYRCAVDCNVKVGHYDLASDTIW